MMDALRSIHDEALRHHLHVLNRFASKPGDYVQAWRHFAQGGTVAGVVLIAPPQEVFQHPVAPGDVPQVLYACRPPPKSALGWPRIDSVVLDNDIMMSDLLSHLAGQGCRRFVHLEGPVDNYDARARSQCFTDFTTRDASVRGAVIPSVERRALVSTKLNDYLDRNPGMPDAFVGFNDDIALGVVDVLKARGIAVPGDVMVTGFDDTQVGAATGLTSVSVPAYAAGREAVRLLFARMNRQIPDDTPQSVTMGMSLKLRASSRRRVQGDSTPDFSKRSTEDTLTPIMYREASWFVPAQLRPPLRSSFETVTIG